jgi:hypothetical protein
MSHTPGPWKFDTDENAIYSDGQQIASICTSDDFPCLADEQRAEVDADGRANGLLIAAAPKLLEASRTAANRIRGFTGIEIDYGVAMTLRDVLKVLEAAIAEAEGE